jgi:tagatose 6-phosphate kinase
MILTVTLNAALDRTYRVDKLALGTTHRVKEQHVQAGGKGVNVSRVLTGFGVSSVVSGLVAGSNGEQIQNDLRTSGMDALMHDVEGESRQTVTVFSSSGDSWVEFDEVGPEITVGEWRGFMEAIEPLAKSAVVVVLSGSLPPGAPVDAYRQLVIAAHGHGARVVLDASGAALRSALDVGPDLVTPNRSELQEISGLQCGTVAEVVVACRVLQKLGAQAVVATLGGDGAIATEGENIWRARHPAVPGNPVGAGDAMTAGLAAGMAEGTALAGSLGRGCAWAVASLRSPWAGYVDPRDATALRFEISVETLDAPRTSRA